MEKGFWGEASLEAQDASPQALFPESGWGEHGRKETGLLLREKRDALAANRVKIFSPASLSYSSCGFRLQRSK